jgi:putative flippase GtrA
MLAGLVPRDRIAKPPLEAPTLLWDSADLMLSRLFHPEYKSLRAQLVRYGIAGVGVTAVNILVYHLALDVLAWSPNLSWLLGFIAAFIVGYPVHSQYSFRGHGQRDKDWRSRLRFLIVSLGGFALNSFWVWSLVVFLKLPEWAPDFPVVMVTPLVAFYINRKWVFE